MKKITLVILSILIGFSAIAKTKHKKKKKVVAVAANNITSVLIMRTGCFGHCPTYSVEINKNGMATYSAIRFNEDSGNYQKNIGVAKAATILNQVQQYRLDTCSESYYNQIPDLPNLNYEIVYNNKTKKIYSAKYGPDFLSILAREIEEVGKRKIGDAGWKKVPEKQ